MLSGGECATFLVEGDQLCTTFRINSNAARTGAGHINSMQHGFSTAEYTDENGVLQWTAHQKLRGHLLVKDGQIAEEASFSRTSRARLVRTAS